jgi:hypothetical protein
MTRTPPNNHHTNDSIDSPNEFEEIRFLKAELHQASLEVLSLGLLGSSSEWEKPSRSIGNLSMKNAGHRVNDGSGIASINHTRGFYCYA